MARRLLTSALLLLAGGLPLQAAECELGAWYLARGDLKRAIAALTPAASDASTAASRHNLRGVAEMMSGELPAAMKSFEAAIAADASLVEARFNRGVLLLKTNELAKAAADFERVYASEGRLRGHAAFHRALAAHLGDRTAEAEVWLERAIAADPELDDALLYLGVVRERQGKYHAAGEAYRKVIERNGASLIARLRFGIVAMRAGRRETARQVLQSVVQMAPNSIEAAEATKYLVLWE